MQRLLILLAICFIYQHVAAQKNTEYLNEVLANLNEIETASYISTSSAYIPYDTIPVYVVDQYFKTYANPADTFLGVSYVRLQVEDTSKMEYCYDGHMRARVHWDEKTMEIDSFKNNPHIFAPLRPISPPFYAKANAIINYATTTMDSISVSIKDYRDSLTMDLIVHDEIVEFMSNKAFHYPDSINPAFHNGDSHYQIWIDKSNDLPYRIKRDMPHNKSIETIRTVEFNKEDPDDFVAKHYFPDYPLRDDVKQKDPHNQLVGNFAPEWTLQDTNADSITLNDLKSRMVLIKFTGIGCGPCHAAVPFLKQLDSTYNESELQIVSIETWSDKLSTIKGYKQIKELPYKCLLSTKQVKNDYHIKAVPVFMLLDEDRKIVDVFKGYSKENSDQKITEAIEKLL